MTTLHHEFNEIAKPEAEEPKYPPPFSMRFTPEERARLDSERGRKPLSTYIREQLLGKHAAPRKRRQTGQIKDSEAFSRALGALGKSRLSANLNQLAKAANTGSLPVTPETEADLRQACREIKALRAEFLRALGKSPGDGP